MPLSGGTSGAHDDAMHQGSAKRDALNGVAGLNSWGELLVYASSIHIRRSGANNIEFRERTSGEYVIKANRVSIDDYIMYLKVGGVWEIVQHEGMKDVVNGIAALDAAGSLLLPGSKMYFTRDGSDDVHIYERTSNEEAYAFHRVGADDYTFFVKESNVWKRMQTESMKDAANGIAGLDANVLLSPALLPPCLEEYSNHLGAVDNFVQTGVAGNGVASSNAANHRMDLSSGVGAIGHGRFESKSDYSLASKPIICNFVVQNIVNGVAGSRSSFFGLRADFSNHVPQNGIFFWHDPSEVWYCYTVLAGATTSTNITSVASGDLCTIVATSSKVLFFVNGTLVFTSTTNIPTLAMELGAAAHDYGGGATTAREISIDMMSLKRYV